MAGEDFWRERAEAAESKVITAQQATEQLKEKVRFIQDTFGIRPSMSGDVRVDFEKLAENLGVEQCLELRRVIDEKWRIRGEPGEKPRVRMSA